MKPREVIVWCLPFELTKILVVRVQELLLTPSELGDRAFQSWYLAKKLGNHQNLHANPYESLCKSLCIVIGFQTKSMVINFKMLYLRAQMELEEVLGL